MGIEHREHLPARSQMLGGRGHECRGRLGFDGRSLMERRIEQDEVEFAEARPGRLLRIPGITEDDVETFGKDVQKILDKNIADIDTIIKNKEAEVFEV